MKKIEELGITCRDWQVCHDADAVWVEDDEGCEVTITMPTANNESHAVARLVAAAPDLYEAVRRLLTYSSDEANWHRAVEFAQNAIEKACKSLEAEKSRIIADRNELAELNRKCCDENERLKDENSNLRSLVGEMTVGLSGALDIIGDVAEHIEVDCGTALRVETYREILAKAKIADR